MMVSHKVVPVVDDPDGSPTAAAVQVHPFATRPKTHSTAAAQSRGSKGLAAVRELSWMYLRMLLPVTIVAVNFFGIFAIISYLVPSVLCTESVKSNQGQQNGFADCVNVVAGHYGQDPGKKLPWLFFWAVQLAWLVMFPAFMGRALFGKAMRRTETAIITTLVCGMALAVFLCSGVSNLSLNNNRYTYLSTGLSTLVTITVSLACARYSRNRVNIARWIILFAVAGVVLAIYIFIIPLIVTKRATPNQLLLVRVVVHPFVWNMIVMLFLHTARHIGSVPNLMQVTFLVWPEIYKAVFGRFLLLQLSGVGDVLLINLIMALTDTVSRLASRSTQGLLLRIMYGSRTAEAISASKEMDQLHLVTIFARSMSEHAGILAASALFSFGGITEQAGVPPNQRNIWASAFTQIATTLVTDYVGLVIDWKYHQLDYFAHLIKDMRRFLFFILFVTTLGGMRLAVQLLLLFCPSYVPGVGVLLEYCDKPSLFSAVGR